MSAQRPPATVVVAGTRQTFWVFIADALFTYAIAIASLVLGPLGALICMLVCTLTTAILAAGLVLFFLQRPGTGLLTIAVLGTIHFALLEYGVPAGLFWLVWSAEGLQWLQNKGLA
jgi:hypothetical protein